VAGDVSFAVATDRAVARWNAHGEPVLDLPMPATALAFLPDGALVAAGGPGLVRWSARGDETGRVAWTAPIGRLAGGFAASTRVAVGGADGVLRIWALDEPGDRGIGLFGGELEPGPLAFSPDGAAVAAHTADGRLHLFDAASGAPLADAPGPGLILGFTPDG